MVDTLEGRVIKGVLAKSSKSEREAVQLVTNIDDKEQIYVLRREGGNAFNDPILDDLIGSYIHAEGNIHNYTFIIKHWYGMDPPK